ncbi:hypothetical protein K503DRAFT_853260 [Rhizopogon vinicolor AM-OR11-026]|uniref:Uncharacterized protein n=1 Tax=Rhizopogon vinicolor AM-OR11-026 TaxID=1314800 RepID=A0A1B7NEZ8_9AGAM|nr:hypothetical protein K503DRAFT_853260 [Rhizopogon vinicolor AM-OR11-026]
MFTGHPYHTMPAMRPPRNNHPLPLSPPETDQESFHVQVPAALVADAELDQLAHSTSALHERSKIQYRKTSALAYQNSGVRDNRDRALARGPKNLIVVLPPPNFPLDHGQLGNVLSMGPRHRLSQGILMPLLPTMYGQLTAIAREFNFPSTVGLCLYHHITDSGITMTPRISDDAWQYLWGHLFESRTPTNGSQQLPISGRVEFDIDLKKARWFDAWLTGTLRDESIVPAPLSHAPIHHWPEDSRSTFAEEHIVNEDRWDNQTTRSYSRPGTLRHVPRKLSLVDRLDSAALQTSYKASQAVASPPSDHIAHNLSPIPQSAVPQPTKAELHQRVNSWRAGALLEPASMAESYQPVDNAALGVGAAVPVDEYPLEREVEAEVQEPLNLADFAWSVTSAGPPSPPLDSPVSPYRLPSVHLDRRMEEFVPLTPSTATTWGPADDDWLSVSSIDRLPSPDIGGRMIESAPLTPATATSWGPADDWRSDVSSVDRLPSPDIAYRVSEDALVIRVSGAPILPSVRSYSPWAGISASSSSWYDVTKAESVPSATSYSPWAGMSASSSSWFDVTKAETVPSTIPYSPWAGISASSSSWFDVKKTETVPSTTSYSPWSGMRDQIWPWFDICASREMGAQSKSNPGLERSTSVNPWAGMPCFNIGPWHDINAAQPCNSLVITLNRPGGLKTRYPSLDIYPPAYPYFDIYPALAEDDGQSSGPSSAGGYPILDIFISSPEKPTSKSVNVDLVPAYPLFNISAAVELSSSVLLPSSYPWLTIYPSVYPHVNPYPQASAEVTRPGEIEDEVAAPVRVKLSPQYPVLDIYPAVYPWNLDTIYPPIKVEEALSSPVLLRSSYPWLIIYPSVYPHVNPYPQATALVTRPRQTEDEVVAPVRVKLPSQYPVLDIYPAVYPWNLDTIYPLSKVKEASSSSMLLRSSYPWLTIYSPVYPHVIPYPQASAKVTRPREAKDEVKATVRVKLPSQYPVLDIYPAVYPWNLDTIYPPSKVKEALSSSVLLQSSYPWLTIYSPVYPHVIPYPQASAEVARPGEAKDEVEAPVRVKLPSQYPVLDIYPAVYPWNLDTIYPPSEVKEALSSSVLLQSSYPWLTIYSPVYPHVIPYPQASAEVARPGEAKDEVVAPVQVKLPSQYPDLDIYPAVYPWNLDTIYSPSKLESTLEITTRLLSHYPWLDIYPSVYPFVEPYTTLSRTCKIPRRSQTSLKLKRVKVNLDRYYPTFDLYPAAYPYFDLYPALSDSSQQEQRIDSTKAHIHTFVLKYAAPDAGDLTKGKVFVSSGTYPYLVIYSPAYPHFDLYPARAAEPTTQQESKGYNITASSYPYLVVYPSVYPYFDLYPSIPSRIAAPTASSKSAISIDHKYPVLNIYPAVYPHFDIYPALCSAVQPLQTADAKLQAEVRKGPAKIKTHRQLHDEVFVKRVVWTPSGYVQDLAIPNKLHDEPCRGPRRREPSVQEVGPRLTRPRSGNLANQQTPSRSPSLRSIQSQSLQNASPIPPLRIGSPGVPAMSESSMHTLQTPPASPTSRVSQAVRSIGSSIISGMQGRNLASTSDDNEQAKSLTRSITSSFDRRSSMIPSLSSHDSSDLTRSRPSVYQAAQSLVLQRARAYEQSTAHSRHQSHNMRGTPFQSPPLRPVPDLLQDPKTDRSSHTLLQNFTP